MLLTSTEIIAKSWDDYLKNWHGWATFSLFIFLPSFILMLSGSFGIYLNSYLPATVLTTNLIIFFLKILSLILGVWITLALSHAIIKYLRSGSSDRWNEHFSLTLPKLWPAIYTSFFVTIFVFLGTIAFIIPGIIIFVWYYFVIYTIAANDGSGFKALEESKKLVRGRWGQVAWRILLPNLFFAVATIVIQGSLVFLVELLPITILTATIFENVATSLVSALAAPLLTLAAINLYQNLKDNPFREPSALLSSEPPTE